MKTIEILNDNLEDLAKRFWDVSKKRTEEWLKTTSGIECAKKEAEIQAARDDMKDKPSITEKDGYQYQWYEDARKVKTIEQFVSFHRHLLKDYNHDYGTICHVVAALACAGAWLANADDAQGGITGFQAQAVMWEFMEHFNGIKAPAKLVQFDNMLYPQYRHKFEKTITPETAKWLKKQAQKKLLEGGPMSPDVRTHMEDIVSGVIPFGYSVVEG